MDTNLSISVDGGPPQTFTRADSPVTVGRDQSCSVVVAVDGVSGVHASVVFVGGAWTYSDSSSHGTFDAGAEVSSEVLSGTVVFTLAEPSTGPRVQFTCGDSAPPAGAGAVSSQVTVAVDGSQPVTFDPSDSPITVGRDAANMVVVDNESVSSRHGSLSWASSRWEYLDPSSSYGSYVDGAKVTSVAVDGVLVVRLVDAASGPTVTVTAGAPAAQELSVTVAGRLTSFDPTESPVTVGRDASNMVVVADPSVSSVHARIEWDGSGWVFHDSSTHGTFRDGVRVDGAVEVSESVVVRLASADGPTVEMSPSPAAGGGLGGPVRQRADERGTRPPPSGDTMRITYGADCVEIVPGAAVVIGRDGLDADADLRTDVGNDLVSRRHAKVSHDGVSWLLEDLGSTRGTFVDGQRVTSQKLQGQVTAWLGSASAGERVEFETSGKHRKKVAPRVYALAGAGALAVVALVVAALLILPPPENNPTRNDVDRMKRATGLVIADNGSGSSTVLCGDNLVLTNAHVAQSDAPGLGLLFGDAEAASESLYLAYPPADDPDGQVEVRFRAEVVTYDGYRDIAVLRIESEASFEDSVFVDGTPIATPSQLNLPCLDVPATDRLPGQTAVGVYGYPGVTRPDDRTRQLNTEVNSDTNEVTSYAEDTFLGETVGWMNLLSPIRSGNSGGLVARENEIYGIPTRGRIDRGRNQARPIGVARPVIDAARAGQTGDVADYLTLLTGSEAVAWAFVDARPQECISYSTSATEGGWLVAEWSGMTPDSHLKVVYEHPSEVGEVQLGSGPIGPSLIGESGVGCVSLGPLNEQHVGRMVLYAGPNYELWFEPTFPDAGS